MVPALPAPPVKIPEPPEGLGEYARDQWMVFFETEVSGAVNMKRDGERLRHWARCMDAREKLWAKWLEEPTIWSVNGTKSNPLFTQVMRLSAEIEKAEAKFGMTPIDKMRMTGALDQAEAAEQSITRRRGRTAEEA